MKNFSVVLASRPKGSVKVEDFRYEESPTPTPADGEVLVRNHYLSLDPYMRSRLDGRKTYADPQALDVVMVGGTVGEVIESRHQRFKAGEMVVGMGGWQNYSTLPASALRKIPPGVSPSAALGPIGMPGVTAWVGLVDIGNPKEGETVVVSSAAGAVGSVVGQLAKARGCRVVGIAGGPDKCRYVVEELGFDDCVDYKAKGLSENLKAAVPNGVDVYFENVGGDLFDAVLERINPFSRIALCGWISTYDSGVPSVVVNVPRLLTMRAKLQGYVISEHLDRWGPALEELTDLLVSGRLKYHETISVGLASAPAAFVGMLKGKNLGKQLVKLI